MNNKEITNAIADLYRATNALEELYIENGGEVTEEAAEKEEHDIENGEEVTEEAAEKEEQIEAIKALLIGEGIDSLGRWLAGKEQEKALLKAEKAALDRRIKAVDGTIDYIKYQVGQVLRATGCEKAKGLAYSFAQATSTTNSINYEAIEHDWGAIAEDAFLEAGLPDWLHITFKTTTKELQEAEAGTYLDTEVKETCRFTKPRAAKEEN